MAWSDEGPPLRVPLPDIVSQASGDGPGHADSGRGAGALKDAGRLVYTLTPMSADEAKAFGVDEAARKALVRYDSAKVNIARKAADTVWFRLVGVQIGNTTTDYPNGDEVQTVERWWPPAIWTTLTTAVVKRTLESLARSA